MQHLLRHQAPDSMQTTDAAHLDALDGFHRDPALQQGGQDIDLLASPHVDARETLVTPHLLHSSRIQSSLECQSAVREQEWQSAWSVWQHSLRCLATHAQLVCLQAGARVLLPVAGATWFC